MSKHQKRKKTIAGSGLTISKMYHDSWILPVKVQVCQIDRIVPELFNTLSERYSLRSLVARATSPPFQVYQYPEGAQVPRKALQLPYRIVLTTQVGGRQTWYIEDQNEFAQLAKLFVKARSRNDDERVINSIIEQQPV